MIALLFAVVLTACGPKAQHLDPIPLRVDDQPVSAEVADTDAEREKGLMYRDPLPPGAGMLFVYPDQKLRAFWMKNTKSPLSIAFINAQGRIVRTADMDPFDETVVPSEFPAMYALEVGRGWFVANNITAGDLVTGLPGPSKE